MSSAYGDHKQAADHTSLAAQPSSQIEIDPVEADDNITILYSVHRAKKYE
jgi:hypothetical protein